MSDPEGKRPKEYVKQGFFVGLGILLFVIALIVLPGLFAAGDAAFRLSASERPWLMGIVAVVLAVALIIRERRKIKQEEEEDAAEDAKRRADYLAAQDAAAFQPHCPSCGREHDAAVRFCPYCGWQLRE
jgi:type VI protein secretion system component VasK